MKMSEEFPTNTQGRRPPGPRSPGHHAERRAREDRRRHEAVLYFKGKEKGVVLNKTNAGTIMPRRRAAKWQKRTVMTARRMTVRPRRRAASIRSQADLLTT
jgi:hypothetical protein